MSNRNLHPTVEQFKQFLNKYPGLREEIRKSGSTWQEYYEKWILLGEDDSMWESYRENSIQGKLNNGQQHEAINQLVKLTKNIDINKVQKQVTQLNHTINMIHGILNDLMKTKKLEQNRNPHVFDMFRD